MQSVDDIWTCNRCGWTYPNHHPSAKHRRNHKKVCGKVPGHIIDDHHSHGNGGSSDEASSGDENHHEVSSAAPTVPTIPAVESQSRSFDLSSALQNSETPSPAATPDKDSLAPPDASKTSLQEAPKAEPVIESSKPGDSHKPVLGSAVPHPEEDIWVCRACGWTYPNAHPSAKHRRNHKKHCGKAGAGVHVSAGSSDDDSDGERHTHTDTQEKTNAPSATEEEPQGQKPGPEPTPMLASTREFSVEPVAPEESVPVTVDEASKEIGANPVEAEAPSNPVPAAAPVVASKGSAVAHLDDDTWLCKECGWTYPNHHPSAKHRRNHKKNCPGKVVAVAPHPGGSSDDDSGDEHVSHDTKLAAANAEEVAPPTESVSREFNLESLTEPAPTAEVQDEKETDVLGPAEVLAEVNSEKEAAPEETEKEILAETTNGVALKEDIPAASGSAVPHPDDDIWICKTCGWTYPNHHPSAKHRRNHKKHCAGKLATATPAPGGSSDEDSGDERHHRTPVQAPVPEVVDATSKVPENVSLSRDFKVDSSLKTSAAPEIKGQQPQNGIALQQVSNVAELQTPIQNEIPSNPLALKEAAKEEAPVDAPPAVEYKQVVESVPASTPAGVAPKESLEDEFLHASPHVAPWDDTKVKPSLGKTSGAFKAGSAVLHPEDDIWICKECGWTYPNHHPSAKHRRNHKKNCTGKVAAAAPVPGGSSDDDSGDEHPHKSPVQVPNLSVMNRTNGPPNISVSREVNVGLLATESQHAVAELLESPSANGALKAQAPCESTPPSPGITKVEKPVELTGLTPTVVGSQESLVKDIPVATSPALAPKDLMKEVKVGQPSASPAALNSAVPHSEEDIWKCRHCDWTYPNAHPSAKHRRNHKKHCPGEAASDDDSDHETDTSASSKEHTAAAARPPTEAMASSVASVSRDFQLPAAEVNEEATSSTLTPPPLQEQKTETPPAPPAAEVNEEATSSTLAPPPLQEQKIEAPPAPPVQPQDKKVAPVGKSPPAVSTPAPKAATGSAALHQDDPNDLWICKACGWTYPNAHPSAKHRRNHKAHCPGKPAAMGHVPGGSSDDDSDNGSSHRGQTPAAASDTAPAEAPIVKERALPDLGVQQPDAAAEVEAPKVEIRERAPLGQLVSNERSREQEAKSQQELKSGASKAPHDPSDTWVCKECGWTYPNPHPSAKHRRNHKKVCKKTNSTVGGSSSDASSDDDHIGHFGKKKCFPCL